MGDAWIVTVDTSVFEAALARSRPGSPAREVLARARLVHFTPACSPMLQAEIFRRLRLAGLDLDIVEATLNELAALALHVDVADHSDVVVRDVGDRFVVALAIVSKSWCIVSQDKDLTERPPESRPPGLSPPKFLHRLREKRGESPDSRVS